MLSLHPCMFISGLILSPQCWAMVTWAQAPATHISKLFLLQNFWELCLYFPQETLTTKAHVYCTWQNYSFCKNEQAQRSPTTWPSQDNLDYVLISATKAHLSN